MKVTSNVSGKVGGRNGDGAQDVLCSVARGEPMKSVKRKSPLGET